MLTFLEPADLNPVGGLPESGERPAEDLAAARATLHRCAGSLQPVLARLQAAEETPDLIVDPQAESLYETIVEIRNTVGGISKYLIQTEWVNDNRRKFYSAFDRIIDASTTYHHALQALKHADWSQQGRPTPVQAMASLEAPRRNYINALEEYFSQLLVVIDSLPG